MKFICIMGRSNSGKTTVEKTLEQMGFKRSISYTTREPRINESIQEQDGVDYKFVTEDKFMALVDKGKIIEYERHNDNLYGTPRPFGAKRYVAVVCLGGYRALRNIYGEQVFGVYLKCDEDTAMSRGETHEDNENILKCMEDEADIVINSNQDLNKMLADILKAFRDKNIE